MDILQKMVFPVKRVWVAVSARLKSSNNGTGLVKLRDDIQTCGYEDVQVMWEMLRTSDSKVGLRKRKQRPFWRVTVWSRHNSTPAN